MDKSKGKSTVWKIISLVLAVALIAVSSCFALHLKSEKAQAVIRGKYKACINPKTGFGGFDPNTAAYCLDMMYE